MLKIIEGEFGSRILQSPEGSKRSRPYAGRLRNSVFNQLRGWFEGARVLDLCAGVGTVGLEAISRGAANAVMIEQNRSIYGILKHNIQSLGCGDRAIAVCQDAFADMALSHAPTPVDLVFVDPPFALLTAEMSRLRILRQITRVRSIMGDRGFVVLRSPVGPPEVDFSVEGFEGPEVQQHKRDHWVMMYAPGVTSASAGEAASEREGAA
jgi:16S rRNA (guanine966-N2)-methyltransferase